MSRRDRSCVAIAGANDEHLFELTHLFDSLDFLLYGVGLPVNENFKGQYIQCEDANACAKEAVRAVSVGEASILMKGRVQTAEILHHILNKDYKLYDSKSVLSHLARLQLPSQTVYLSDAALNIAPSFDQMVGIVDNAVNALKLSGLDHPKVAILSAAETVNQKMPSSLIADALTDCFKGYSDRTVFGPLSLDLALSREAASEKNFVGPIMGDADLLIVSAIEVANVLYKSLTLFANAKASGLILGARVPIVVTSRADSLMAKKSSLMFALEVIR